MNSTITEMAQGSKLVKAKSPFVTIYVGAPLAIEMDLAATQLGITRSKLGKILVERGLAELKAESI